jgi:calpain-15
MYKNGIKQMVIIDNYFPCRNMKPCFSRAHGKELWVLILEKAWAKLHGSYQKITSGQSFEVFRDILGAPSFYYKANTEDIWDHIQSADKKKYIICCTALPIVDVITGFPVKMNGIVANQSYSIIEVRVVKEKNGKKTKLLKIRNPDGLIEWKGDWSDNSSKWTPELKRECNLVVANDGIFWMALEDFVERVISVHISHFREGCNFNFVEVKEYDNKDGWHIFSIDLDTPGDHTLGVSQVDKLCIPTGRDYKYSSCRIILVKLINDFNMDEGVIFISGIQEDWERDYYLICEKLAAGKYYAFVEFDWNEKGSKDKNTFSFNNYGPGNCQFTNITK